MDHEPRPLERWARQVWQLRRAEWIVVGLIAASIVGVNKLVVHDTGNSWPGLVLVSVATGVLAVHAWRWFVGRRATGGT